MSSGVTFTATVYCPGATLTPTITPTSTVTPTVTASITPTLSVSPSPSSLQIDDCNTSVHTMNAYNPALAKEYYVEVGSTSGTLAVTVEIVSQDDLKDCLLFIYGGVIIASQCMGGSGHTVGTILNISIPYKYDSEVGTKIKVVQTTDTSYCCGDVDAETFITNAELTGTTEPNAIRNLVANLKSTQLWNKFLCIHPMAGNTNQQHTWNLITQTNFNTTLTTAGATHNSFGITWSAPSFSRARVMEFYPSTSGLLLNSAHISVFNYLSEGSLASPMGVVDTGTDGLYMKIGNGLVSCAINGAEIPTQAVSGLTEGFMMANRIDGNYVNIYKNGNSVAGPIASSSVSLCSTQRMYYGLLNESGTGILPTSNAVAFYSIGFGMTDTEAKLFYKIFWNYHRQMGRTFS
jgi:hypothetical protein